MNEKIKKVKNDLLNVAIDIGELIDVLHINEDKDIYYLASQLGAYVHCFSEIESILSIIMSLEKTYE